MVAWTDLLGEGSSARQFLLWGVGQQLAGQILAPPLTELQQRLFEAFPIVVLTPSQLADMVVKGILSEQDGSVEARQSGMSSDRFHRLVEDTGEPPDLTLLLEAWRRQYIGFEGSGPDQTTVEQGVRESHIKDKWLGVIQKMALVPIPAADAVEAVVRGQIDYATGETIAYQNGVSHDGFRILVDTTGNPPSPTELVEFMRRGFIPTHGTGPDVLSFQQGIYEGSTKNKWEPLYEKLAEYLPPPRTITALERDGAITPDQAQALYLKSGLSPELAAAYSHSASATKTAKHKDLAESTILTLYVEQFLTRAEAGPMLSALGYSADEQTLLFDLADFRRLLAQLNAAITRVRSLFVSYKLDKAGARGALGQLGLPGSQVESMLSTWTVERGASVKVLTQAEVVDAWHYAIIDQPTAITELQALGYTPYDAWVLLSVKNHAPLPDQPPKGPAPAAV